MPAASRHEADTADRQIGGNENSRRSSMNVLWRTWPLLSTAALGVALMGVDALANGGEGMARLEATLARVASGEASTLYAVLFFTTVWIVSSLRIHRFRTLWRVGPRRKAMRGISGLLLTGVPKARAAVGGSMGGAGASGIKVRGEYATGGQQGQDESVGTKAVLDNFRG